MSSTDSRDTIDAMAPGEGLRAYVRREIRNYELRHRSSAPGQVVAFDPATGIAQVQVGYLQIAIPDVPGVGEVETPLPPDLVLARVMVLAGTTHSDQPPIPVAGDTGILFFLDRCTDLWFLGPGSPVDPVDCRAHDMADAVFLPALSPDALRPAPAANPLARTIEAPQIVLGAAAVPGVDNVAIASLVHTYLTAMITAAPVVALDGGASFKAALIAYLGANPPTAFAAEKVSAQ